MVYISSLCRFHQTTDYFHLLIRTRKYTALARASSNSNSTRRCAFTQRTSHENRIKTSVIPWGASVTGVIQSSIDRLRKFFLIYVRNVWIAKPDLDNFNRPLFSHSIAHEGVSLWRRSSPSRRSVLLCCKVREPLKLRCGTWVRWLSRGMAKSVGAGDRLYTSLTVEHLDLCEVWPF